MKKEKSGYLFWIVLALLGIFLIFGHNVALDIVCKIIAIGLILLAVSGVVAWWKSKSKAPAAIASLVGSLAFCVLGIWILCNTQGFIDFINIVLGIVMIVTGLLSLYRGWKLHHTLTMILACIGIVLGVIIACYNAATTFYVVCEGIGLIYTAITGLLGERGR